MTKLEDGSEKGLKGHFKEDFSQGEDGDKHWFMHEMVHVWQHQLPRLRR